MKQALWKFALFFLFVILIGADVFYSTDGETLEYVQGLLILAAIGFNVIYFIYKAPRLGRAISGGLLLGFILPSIFKLLPPPSDVAALRNSFFLMLCGLLIVDVIYYTVTRHSANMEQS
ncbi:MAG: hypothetical protein ABR577_07965 [Pyrinomonadaceae bacterium]